jgi:hypothetical protein
VITRDAGAGSCIVGFEKHLLVWDGWTGSCVQTKHLFTHTTGGTLDILCLASSGGFMLTRENSIGDEAIGGFSSNTNPCPVLAHEPHF